MNNVNLAKRKATRILSRDFDGECVARVSRNNRRAQKILNLLNITPLTEENRQAIIMAAMMMVNFTCPKKSKEAKRSRRNAADIILALPDVIISIPSEPDEPHLPHTNMLKSGPTETFIKASPKMGSGPGYSLWMTLAALDLDDITFDEMLSYMVSMNYRTCVFYIRSGTNMRQVFGRNDFDCWGNHAKIIDRCNRMKEVGIAPCPVMMSNQDSNFNRDWMGNLYPRIRSLLDDLIQNNLINQVMQGIEIDRSWNNSLRRADENHNYHGVRMVMDTIGGDAETGGLKTIHYPQLTWIGHFSSTWNTEAGTDIDRNYAGPRDAFPTWRPGGKFAWYDVVYHQQNPRWGSNLNDRNAKRDQLVKSWNLAVPLIRRDGAIPVPFEYGQEPKWSEADAQFFGAALLSASRELGIGDGFGTGATL